MIQERRVLSPPPPPLIVTKNRKEKKKQFKEISFFEKPFSYRRRNPRILVGALVFVPRKTVTNALKMSPK